MKHRIAEGQIYVDDDGDAYELVKVSSSRFTLQSADGELLFCTPGDLLRDIESGNLELMDDSESQ